MSGMFGAKPDWGQAISAALNGWLAAGGNQVGAMNLQQMHSLREDKQRQQLAEQNYQRQRQDAMQDWLAKQQYEAEHQGPDEFTQQMMNAGIDPASDQGKQLYQQLVQNKANPFTQMRVQNPDGSESLQFMRPTMAPTAPVGNLRPLGAGGPAPQAPGGFLGF